MSRCSQRESPAGLCTESVGFRVLGLPARQLTAHELTLLQSAAAVAVSAKEREDLPFPPVPAERGAMQRARGGEPPPRAKACGRACVQAGRCWGAASRPTTQPAHVRGCDTSCARQAGAACCEVKGSRFPDVAAERRIKNCCENDYGLGKHDEHCRKRMKSGTRGLVRLGSGMAAGCTRRA